MADPSLDLEVLVEQFRAEFDLPESFLGGLRAELSEILESGSDGKKLGEVKRLQSEYKELDYYKGEKIGNGAFGEVYKGLCRRTKQEVAIKIIDLEETKEDIGTIRREVSVLAQGQGCPQLTRYYGSQVVSTKLWIVMEFVSGGSVADLLKEKPLEERYIAIIAREVLLALKYMAAQGKFHRDIKAANILLSAEGQVKLADFGASGSLTDTVQKSNTLVGSPYWIAPEVLMGEHDAKVDIWSLGITCIEMAKQKAPNSHLPPLRAVQLIPTQPAPRLRGDNFSNEIKEFIATCLHKDPTQRPTINDLLRHPFVANAGEVSVMRELLAPSS
eukprot:TRINITY_DN4389_c0_g3_i2.p1 TRINITY_DN4389_c0_g3~~TRINITY_DN4389_c0_g3_i2.p1  ORF type:complete len:330 (+),score=106.66 TRINITY_DN4389_c0_g3_i2:60-1049(+)